MLLVLQQALLDTPVFGSNITWGQLLVTVGLTILVLWIGGKFIRRLVIRGLQARGLEPATAHAAGTIAYYLLVVLGIAVVLQSTGVDLSSLAVVAGALSLGIGFGLQNVVGNFVSGLVLLIEQPIKVGDRVEVESLVGTVRKIGARATTIVTNDEIAIIVPNSDFTNNRVTNWSYTGRRVRFSIPVGVSYKSDPEVVRKALLEAAAQEAAVATDSRSDVVFIGFGDSALQFELRVWTSTHIHVPKVFISTMNFAIWEALARHGVEVPFPQRDLHVKSGSLLVETRPALST